MTRILACVAVLAAVSAPGRAEPPPLTESQRARIAKLANDTRQETDRLKGALDNRQRELALLYAEYKLDEVKAARLESEIIDLQKQLLANYRKMQVELRTLVGEERFNLLRQRIDNMLKTPTKPK